MRGEKVVNRVNFSEKGGEVATTLFYEIVAIIFGFRPVVFILGVNIFPLDIFEELGRGGGVGNNASSE